MINLIRNTARLLRFLYLISKHQILTYSGKFKISLSFKVLGWICCFFLYPKNIFIAPGQDFAKRLKNYLYELGPIYIKLGQTLSTRPDLIGTEIAADLQSLQDKLPPFDSKIVISIIEKRFDKKIDDIFLEFDEIPVAAASIAQVHKAKLQTGEEVAVKLLRPYILKKYTQDIYFLEWCASIISFISKKTRRLKPKEVVYIFKQSMKFELDLRAEGASASRLRNNFIDDDTIIIPQIYWSLTSRDVITLEWINGVSVYNKEKITKLSLDTMEIAKKISVIFFNQAYRDGFFHADLHPGNILICPSGKIALIDFGIIGILSKKDRFAIAEILYAFLQRDYQKVAKIHHAAGYIPKDTNLDYFAQSCMTIAEPIMGRAIKDISIGNLLSQLFSVTEEYGMETQPQLLLLQKTMVMVEGVGYNLNPNVNMWELARPWINKWVVKNLSPEAKIFRFIKEILEK